MKRILTIALAILMLLSVAGPAGATIAEYTEPVETAFSSTASFLEMMDLNGIDYELLGLDSSGETEVVYAIISMSQGQMGAFLFFASDLEHCTIRIWNLIDFDESNKTDMYRVCNELNSYYKYCRFYVDEEDCSVTCQYDVIFRNNETAGDVCFEAMAYVAVIANNALQDALKAYAL